MVWKFLTGDWRMKILTGLFALLCLVIIFLASSRGSIVGIIVGSLFIAGIAVVRRKKEGRIEFLRQSFLTVVLLLGIVIFARDLRWTKEVYEYLDQVLQLSQEYRGLDTGFTGRSDKWLV
jgi:energy-coupling factor transporter transmembrane protein EcfT